MSLNARTRTAIAAVLADAGEPTAAHCVECMGRYKHKVYFI